MENSFLLKSVQNAKEWKLTNKIPISYSIELDEKQVEEIAVLLKKLIV
jgi:hypothetical protein